MNYIASPLERLTPEDWRVLLPNNTTVVYPINIHPLPKQGLSSEMYSFQLASDPGHPQKKKEYILRVYRKGCQEKALKEFELLRSLKKYNISVPQVYCFKVNYGSEEKPFMIMESIEGKTSAEFLRDKMNAPFILDKLAEVLSKIHRLEPSIIKDANTLHAQYELLLRQLIKMRFFTQKTQSYFGCFPLQRKFISSLKRSKNLEPKRYRPVILQGEYTPDHVLVSNNQFTVIDWGEALVGDPAFDVAWIYHELNLYFKTNKVNLGELFIQYYEKHSGHKLSNIEFCKDMAALKLAWEYRLSPYLRFSLFGYYSKTVDLMFGSVLGKLTQVVYMRRLKTNMQNHHTNVQRNVEDYHKYLVRYFEENR